MNINISESDFCVSAVGFPMRVATPSGIGTPFTFYVALFDL